MHIFLSHVLVFVLTFLNSPDGCTEEVDFISVSVPLQDGPHVIRVICGTKRPPMLMSNGVIMDVTFVSRSTSSARGFSAVYKFVTGKPPPPPHQSTSPLYKPQRVINGGYAMTSLDGSALVYKPGVTSTAQVLFIAA